MEYFVPSSLVNAYLQAPIPERIAKREALHAELELLIQQYWELKPELRKAKSQLNEDLTAEQHQRHESTLRKGDSLKARVEKLRQETKQITCSSAQKSTRFIVRAISTYPGGNLVIGVAPTGWTGEVVELSPTDSFVELPFGKNSDLLVHGYDPGCTDTIQVTDELVIENVRQSSWYWDLLERRRTQGLDEHDARDSEIVDSLINSSAPVELFRYTKEFIEREVLCDRQFQNRSFFDPSPRGGHKIQELVQRVDREANSNGATSSEIKMDAFQYALFRMASRDDKNKKWIGYASLSNRKNWLTKSSAGQRDWSGSLLDIFKENIRKHLRARLGIKRKDTNKHPNRQFRDFINAARELFGDDWAPPGYLGDFKAGSQTLAPRPLGEIKDLLKLLERYWKGKATKMDEEYWYWLLMQVRQTFRYMSVETTVPPNELAARVLVVVFDLRMLVGGKAKDLVTEDHLREVFEKRPKLLDGSDSGLCDSDKSIVRQLVMFPPLSKSSLNDGDTLRDGNSLDPSTLAVLSETVEKEKQHIESLLIRDDLQLEELERIVLCHTYNLNVQYDRECAEAISKSWTRRKLLNKLQAALKKVKAVHDLQVSTNPIK